MMQDLTASKIVKLLIGKNTPKPNYWGTSNTIAGFFLFAFVFENLLLLLNL